MCFALLFSSWICNILVPSYKIYLSFLKKTFYNKLLLFLYLVSIIQDSLDYISTRNEQGQNRFHKEKQK